MRALEIIRLRGVRRLPVAVGGMLVGLVTDGDIKRAEPSTLTESEADFNRVMEETPLSRIMIQNPLTTTADAPLLEAADILLNTKYGALAGGDGGPRGRHPDRQRPRPRPRRRAPGGEGRAGLSRVSAPARGRRRRDLVRRLRAALRGPGRPVLPRAPGGGDARAAPALPRGERPRRGRRPRAGDRTARGGRVRRDRPRQRRLLRGARAGVDGPGPRALRLVRPARAVAARALLRRRPLATACCPTSPRWPELVAALCRLARRAVVVDYPTRRSVNAVADLFFGLKKGVEGDTRPFTVFRDARDRGAPSRRTASRPPAAARSSSSRWRSTAGSARPASRAASRARPRRSGLDARSSAPPSS